MYRLRRFWSSFSPKSRELGQLRFTEIRVAHIIICKLRGYLTYISVSLCDVIITFDGKPLLD